MDGIDWNSIFGPGANFTDAQSTDPYAIDPNVAVLPNPVLTDPGSGTAAQSDWTSVLQSVSNGVNSLYSTVTGYQTTREQIAINAQIAQINANAALSIAQKNALIAQLNAQTQLNKSAGLTNLTALFTGGAGYNLVILALTAAGVYLAFRAMKH